MKNLVYSTPVTSEEDLISRVHGAVENLTRQLHLLGHVCEAQHHRCRSLYNDVRGTQLEPCLYCRLPDVLHMYGLLTTCGTDISMLYSAQTVWFRTWVPS